VIEHARRSHDGDVDEPHPRREAPPAPPLSAALELQRSAGNQAVARMLSRTPRMIARFDHEYSYNGGKLQQETIGKDGLQDAAERVIEDDLGGMEELFMHRDTGSSPEGWARQVWGLMQDRFTFDDVTSDDVLPVIDDIKDEQREVQLQRLAGNFVYFSGEPPETLGELVDRMRDRGAFLDVEVDYNDEVTGADGPALKALFNSQGQTAGDEVEFDDTANIQLLDEDDVLVLIDSHQQKHQHPSARVAQFGTYRGKKGSRFAKAKDLEWHRANTAQTVKAMVLEAVRDGRAKKESVYATPKTPRDGIVYDLAISWDESGRKWVGSYHCNPVRSES
jgi:hypothetical protein